MKEQLKQRIRYNTIGRVPRSRFLYKVCQTYIRHYFGVQYGLKVDDSEVRFASYVVKNKPEAIVFDVGANVGEWTLELLKHNPTVSVHAFEPAPHVFAALKENVDFPNVTPNQVAVGARQDILDFYEYKTSHCSTLHKRIDKEPVAVHQVNVISLSDYCRDNDIHHVDYLKVDTEGNDFFVLQGVEGMLENQQIDAVQFEYAPENIDSHVLLKDVFAFLDPLPYQVFRIYRGFILPVTKYHHQLENFISVNYALVAESQVSRYASYMKSKKL